MKIKFNFHLLHKK